ncbi:hypothetical protein E2C01_024060 [Portunus trituberculatus]|uniref:Uncharacterized protein n=1 Tax=Portunus trituberculatus TaxID=210409 RepID=A0A5B7E9N7_PORTR|nr:hypothetical protein [Portunus trituberculatus]
MKAGSGERDGRERESAVAGTTEVAQPTNFSINLAFFCHWFVPPAPSSALVLEQDLGSYNALGENPLQVIYGTDHVQQVSPRLRPP